jgi:hypothetical protein
MIRSLLTQGVALGYSVMLLRGFRFIVGFAGNPSYPEVSGLADEGVCQHNGNHLSGWQDPDLLTDILTTYFSNTIF